MASPYSSHLQKLLHEADAWQESPMYKGESGFDIGWSKDLDPGFIGVLIGDIEHNDQDKLILAAQFVFKKKSQLYLNKATSSSDSDIEELINRTLIVAPLESLRHGDLTYATENFFNGIDIPGWDNWIFHVCLENRKRLIPELVPSDYIIAALIPENQLKNVSQALSDIKPIHVAWASRTLLESILNQPKSKVIPS